MEARKRATESALMTPAEVAALFRVDPKTVGRWARAGKLSYVTTAGGHRRFFRDQVMEMLGEVHTAEDD
ncbi:BldC family transcriptional regulator [Nocardioides speluncae]|uniref:BldC family transcriptional regulator n=1 Tax=Nocardioides speluncae TaxID=2670337 RepID=UPI000D69C241|nr:BldC family transcriptional regulator [Nocardioides speluncae]